MVNDPLLKFKIAANIIPGIGCITAKKIIAHTGGPEALFSEKKSNLLKIPGVGTYLASRINKSGIIEQAEREIEFLKKNKIKPLFYLDKEFPERLKHCEDGPIIIFCKGNIDLNRKKILSVVGTRSSSERGNKICEKIIQDLSDRGHNILIVSGLAYGIDIVSHRSALKFKLDTVGVLAHGLDLIYPNIHRGIAKRICLNGGLITEFLSNSHLIRENFVKRNRIIAGLADATVIIESRAKGGAMITADIANTYNRDVFAIPGRINDELSNGCNILIKNNMASLIQNAEDIEKFMQWDIPDNKPHSQQSKIFIQLSNEEKLIVELLKSGSQSLDQICIKCKINMSKISAYLLNLEFSGIIKSSPGKIYSKS